MGSIEWDPIAIKHCASQLSHYRPMIVVRYLVNAKIDSVYSCLLSFRKESNFFALSFLTLIRSRVDSSHSKWHATTLRMLNFFFEL